MESSTPSQDIRRKTLLKNTVVMSPLRRSLNISFHDTSLLRDSNDETERSARRTTAEFQKRLSIITPDRIPLNESYIKEQFVICTHLFTENKITTKNAWDIQIIDLLKPICQKIGKDSLQVASTSIDICTKVYIVRVDDLHSDGLKLASSMARMSNKAPPADGDGEENDENPEMRHSSKRKKKKRPTGQKTTVVNTKTTIATVRKLDPVDFTTRINADSSAIDNLFTNVLKEDSTNTTFAFLDKGTTLMADDLLIQSLSGNGAPISCLPPLGDITNIRLNVPFGEFEVDEWDPDREDKLLDSEKTIFSHNHEVMFDENGLPIAELDGSIPDIFENQDVDNNDDDVEFVQEMLAPQLRGEVAHIVDFRSINGSVQRSEYSYNAVITTPSGNFIDQIWAGPSHWKLKFIRNSSTKFSGALPEAASKQKRKRTLPQMIVFSTQNIDWSKLHIKKKLTSVDINKITRPIRYNVNFDETIDELMLKPGLSIVEKKRAENLEYDVAPYKYENPNDSLYCSQNNGENGADGVDDHSENEDYVMMEQQQFLGENLVDVPQMVQEAYIPYAMKAKKMDMKKLKAAIWQKLTNNMISIVNKESQQRSGTVVPTTFSSMYKDLPEILPEKERKELTCPLAFVALLHLCNEQNLELKQLNNINFHIRGPK